MTENFTEVVQFKWEISQTSSASESMLANLAKIEQQINSVARTAQEAFGSFPQYLQPAINSTAGLSMNLQHIIEQLAAIKGMGPIDPFRNMGRAPTPPPPPPSGPGDSFSNGGYTSYSNGQIRGPAGTFVSANNQNFLASRMSDQRISDVQYSGEIAYRQNYLGGGGDGPVGTYPGGRLTSYGTQGGVPTSQRAGDMNFSQLSGQSNAERLVNSWMNDSKFTTESFGGANQSGISQAEFDRLNAEVKDFEIQYMTREQIDRAGVASRAARAGGGSRDIGQNVLPIPEVDAGPSVSSYPGGRLNSGAITSARLTDQEAANLADLMKSIGRNGAGLINNYTTPTLTRGGLTSQPLSDDQLTKITQAMVEFSNRPAAFSDWQGPLGSLPDTRSINSGQSVDLAAMAQINARSVSILQDLTGGAGASFGQWKGSSGMELTTRPNMGWQSNFYNPQLPNMTMGNGFTMYPPGFNPGPMSATPFSWPLLGAPAAASGPGMMGAFSSGGGGAYGGFAGGGGGGGGGAAYVPGSGFGYGPFGENYVQQIMTKLAQATGQNQFANGDMAGGENTMQTWWIPEMLKARNTAANQNQEISNADFSRLPGPTGQKYYDQFFYKKQGQYLGDQMASAQSAVPPDPNKIQAIGEQIKANNSAQKDLNESTGQFDGMITRVATRIAVYSAIFGLIQLASNAAKSFTQNLMELNDVSARTGFINGQSQNATQGQFAQAAQYGVAPAQAGQGILTGAQLGSSLEQQKQAGQLAEVFGTNEYSNALMGLNRIQAQVNATGLQHVEVMDFIAQSYKTAPGSLESYFSALQHGIDLNAQFGVSAEAMGLAIEKASVGTGQSADQINVTFQSILSKIATPATQAALRPEGITSGTSQDMVAQIVAKYEQLAAVGDRPGIQKLGEALQGGGIGGYSRIGNLPVVFSSLNDALDKVNPSLAKFDSLFSGVSGTGTTKVNQLTAAWQSFLLALGNTGPIQTVFDFITTGLTSDTGILNSLGKIIPGIINNIGSIATSNPMSDAKRLANYEELNPLKSGFDFGNNPAAFGAYLADYIAKVIDYMNSKPGTMGERAAPSRTSGEGLRVPRSVSDPYPAPIQDFGGLQTLPPNIGLPEYTRMVQQEETSLKIAGVPVQDKNYEVMNKSGELLGLILADSNAIKITNEKIAMNTSSFGGAAPAGLSISTAADFQAKVTAEDTKLRNAGVTLSDPKTEVFQDKATGALISIKGTNEGIQWATQQMAANIPSFGGMTTKGIDYEKLQARVNELNPQVLNAGLPPDPITKIFYDETTRTWKTIQGQNAAIQIANEEQVKLLQQQITGTFNVPSGGEAVVAFFALQQGFVPGGAGGSTGAAALNGSASQLNLAGIKLQMAADALRGDIGGLGSMYWHQQQSQESADRMGFRTPQTSNYHPNNPNALNPLGYPGEFHTPQTSNYSATPGHYSTFPSQGSPYSTDPSNRKLLPIGPSLTLPRESSQGGANVNINNAIRINIDGKQVAYYINRKTYRQFESVRNSVSGSPNRVVGI